MRQTKISRVLMLKYRDVYIYMKAITVPEKIGEKIGACLRLTAQEIYLILDDWLSNNEKILGGTRLHDFEISNPSLSCRRPLEIPDF